MYDTIPDDYTAFGAMAGEIYQIALTVRRINISDNSLNINRPQKVSRKKTSWRQWNASIWTHLWVNSSSVWIIRTGFHVSLFNSSMVPVWSLDLRSHNLKIIESCIHSQRGTNGILWNNLMVKDYANIPVIDAVFFFKGYQSEWAFFTLALFFSLVSACFIAFTAVKRKSPIMKYVLLGHSILQFN